ncbi:MAG: MFS transporter [Holosporaceae bacterium]|jgi:MFS family permease|nr:MFS transporter [Holosporaceae bacterium]
MTGVKKSPFEGSSKPQEVISQDSTNGFLRIFKAVPRGVFAVSFFGLFLGMSMTMVYSQIGMFMKTEIHATEATVALMDGIIEFVSFMCRVFVGAISDCLRERKLFLMIGCIITLFARPFLATAATSFMVTAIGAMERIGNGLQATPRDALIADLSPAENRGMAYGFSRSMKTVGALMGIPIAILIMYFTGNNYRIVFTCAAFPALIAIICLMKIKTPSEAKSSSNEPRTISNPFRRRYLKSLDVAFWKVLALAFMFELGHFTETLLPIYANQYLSRTTAGSESMFVSLGQILMSFPVGLCADRFGKPMLIRICMACMVIANLSFIFIESIFGVYLGAFLWGGQMTAIQGLFLSIISSMADARIRATAIGTYYITIGASFLTASVIAGRIWTNFGGKYAFMYSLCVSCFALCMSLLLLPRNKGRG